MSATSLSCHHRKADGFQIKEQFRESIGLHTCDMRSNKSVISATYRLSPTSSTNL